MPENGTGLTRETDRFRRQVFLDTETTGLSHRQGHRIIEIGCVERLPAGRRFHHYLNPGRGIDAGAFAVHGITNRYLRDKPRFADIAGEFLDFIRDAELIIHNASFDIGFLNAELALLNEPPIEAVCRQVTDSLRLAREIHPGGQNSLDALCERYGIDHSERTLHGALLDAEILAEVYAAMTRCRKNPIDEREG
jgi:DNA polymerase-3 subunit epsilon